MMFRIGGALLLGLLIPRAVISQTAPVMSELESGTDALLQAVSPVDASVVWVSGHAGAVLRAVDGGVTWQGRPVQTLDSLEFRDIHAFDADRAVILSAGTGAESRIYRTLDGLAGAPTLDQLRAALVS